MCVCAVCVCVFTLPILDTLQETRFLAALQIFLYEKNKNNIQRFKDDCPIWKCSSNELNGDISIDMGGKIFQLIGRGF